MLLNIFLAFLGYIVGRLGHFFIGNKFKEIPHHWISGLGFILIGLVWRSSLYGWQFAFFGTGLLISDLKDFLKLKTFEPDPEGKKRFWNID